MGKFKDFLNERLITFNKKRPKYNQVVILAGGAGSGKGFVTSNLIGIEAKTFDVDKLKKQALNSAGIKERAFKEFNVDLDTLDLRNPKDVSTLHSVVSQMGLDKKVKEYFLKNKTSKYKDNIIFDVTMKDLHKLANLSKMVQDIGYKKEEIHIVWVINDMDTAIMQNAKRDRVVDQDILINTHKMVSYNIANILKDGVLRQYMDGDFWFVFNKIFTDGVLKIAKKKSTGMRGEEGKSKSGSYIRTPNIGRRRAEMVGKEYDDSAMETFYFKIKETGKLEMRIKDIADNFITKLKKYVPDKLVWN